ncbi:MAG: hypothetical protein AAF654_00285 [Myxococcota bacterium]
MNGATAAFEIACSILQEQTELTGPQVRGCVRLALKAGGLRAATVSARELAVVFERLMPRRLMAQGLSAAASGQVCSTVIARLATTEDGTGTRPGDMLTRLDRARDD